MEAASSPPEENMMKKEEIKSSCIAFAQIATHLLSCLLTDGKDNKPNPLGSSYKFKNLSQNLKYDENDLEVAQYLLLWFLRKLPVVGFELVELVKLHADVFYGELKQIPEPSQVLCCGPWVGIHVLVRGKWESTVKW